MTDLIGAPFELFGIQVGPRFSEAQLAPGAQGLYVRTLHGWLRMLVAVTGDSRFHPGEDPDKYDPVTVNAVNFARQKAGLDETGLVDAEVWIYLQSVLEPSVLPPDPNVLRPEFPAPNPGEDFNALLRTGLRAFGFRFSFEEQDYAVSLFQRLARGQKRGPTEKFTGGSFDDTRFWRKKWKTYEHTWGQFFGAPWLGVVIDNTEEQWGSRSLFGELYRIGKRYLELAKSVEDLRARLAAPIHVRAIAGRRGEQLAKEISYPGLEPILTCSSPLERAAVTKWLQAFDAVVSSAFMSGDNALAGEFQPAPAIADGRLPIRVAKSSRSNGALYVTRDHMAETYARLQADWNQDFHVNDEDLKFLYRTMVYVGTYLPEGWRAHLPKKGLAVVNGAVEATRSRALLIVRGVTVLEIKINGEVRPTPSALPFAKLDQLGVSLLPLELDGLTENTTYSMTVRHTPLDSPGAETTEWTFRTLPASMPPDGISFVAASCYYDFEIPDVTGALELGRRPGDVYYSALSSWINSSSFFKPRFKVLMGDNIYLDVAPDYVPNLYMVDADADTIGRYLRYWLCSNYRHVLATLPTFAIPDDHEYWNDYPRSQAQVPRSLEPLATAYAAAARTSLRAFQGVMTPLPSGGSDEVKEFSYQWSIDSGSTCAVSFFFLDATSTRKFHQVGDTPERLASPEIIAALETWAEDLKGPGVLIVGQPLLVPQSYLFEGAPADYHPSAFRDDFRRIMIALASAPWDVLIVTGDVHWNRLVDCDLEQFAPNLVAPVSLNDQLGARHRPRLVEFIASPAQRLPTKAAFGLGTSPLNITYAPEWDPPEQILGSAPWTTNESTPANEPIPSAPRGPRVLTAGQENATFGSIRCQPIHPFAMRVDLAFVDGGGNIATQERRLIAETARPTGAVRWCLPNEWVQFKPVPPGTTNGLWKDYNPGNTIVSNVRPFYPNGTYADDEEAALPPITTPSQFVRQLQPDERLFVKRVLYQARKAGATKGAYQCVEVATANDLDAQQHYGSAVTARYFVWSIYDDKVYLVPCKDQLYSVILRKRLPWVEPGDRIKIPEANTVDLFTTELQFPFPQEKERYEFGEIAHAPFTPHAVRWLDQGEEGIVKQVIYQAEQTLIQGVIQGPYQLLEVEMDWPGTTPPLSGLIWSVYNGRDLIEVLPGRSNEVRATSRRRRNIDENMSWLRRSSGRAPNRYWAAERLVVLTENPDLLNLDWSPPLLGAAALLNLWIRYNQEDFVDFVANVYAFEEWLSEEEIRIRIGDQKIRVSKELRGKPVDAMCLEIVRATLEGSSVAKLAEFLEKLLGGKATPGPANPVPEYVAGVNEVILAGVIIGGVAQPFVLLRSKAQLVDSDIVFDYWPHWYGNTGPATINAEHFYAQCRGVITWSELVPV